MQPISGQSPQLTLILFTQSYPYDVAAEQTFLAPEVEYLVTNFQVIIVPEQNGGGKSVLPDAIQVEEDFARMMQANSGKASLLLKALFSRSLWKELVTRPSVLLQPFSLKWLIVFVGKAELTRKWVCHFIARHKLDTSRCIVYTLWLDVSAMGVGLAKQSFPRTALVSRAHGYDLYEERHRHAYFPCRPQSLKTLDRLFPDSDMGSRYVAGRYPWFASRCETARLGVTDPGFVTSCSSDGVFRIVSCSFVVPVKRVDLILKGIQRATQLRPNQQFEWHHFGTGPLKLTIENNALKMLPANVKSYFPGYSTVEHLMQYYRGHPVDLFMNVSVTEGTPVAVMEAISCGIPVMATAVGGNPEIVSEQNGRLLSPNPTPDEIAEAILSILDNPDLAIEKRKGSRQVWQEKYNASQNFQAFADRLKAIRAQL